MKGKTIIMAGKNTGTLPVRNGTVNVHGRARFGSTDATQLLLDGGAYISAAGPSRSASNDRGNHVAADHDHTIRLRDMLHVELLVPERDNEGCAFPESAFDALECLLLALAGGFTRRGTVEGVWRSPTGTVLRDRSRAYAISVRVDGADVRSHILDAFVCSFFRQEAAFVELSRTTATVF